MELLTVFQSITSVSWVQISFMPNRHPFREHSVFKPVIHYFRLVFYNYDVRWTLYYLYTMFFLKYFSNENYLSHFSTTEIDFWRRLDMFIKYCVYFLIFAESDCFFIKFMDFGAISFLIWNSKNIWLSNQLMMLQKKAYLMKIVMANFNHTG